MSTEATFLTEQQIWGDDRGNGQLQVMKSYGTKAGMSDLAIVLGGMMGSSTKTSDNQRSGYLWSASSVGNVYVRTVHLDGGRYFDYPIKRLAGARPALPSSFASSIKPSEARLKRKITGLDGVEIEVKEYGEYPQIIAFADIEKTDPAKAEKFRADLEQSFLRKQLKATGKKYTFDGEKSDAYDRPFDEKNAIKCDEYQHNGKHYIRVEARPYDNDSVLSNGKTPKSGEACWIEVQPIEWLKDPTGVWVSRQALFSGVQFDSKQRYDGKFDAKDARGKYLIGMKRYLMDHFVKEMQVNHSIDPSAVVGPSTAAVAERLTRRRWASEDPSRGL